MKQIVKEKSTKKSLKNSYKLDTNKGSVVILGGLTFVNFPLCIHLC